MLVQFGASLFKRELPVDHGAGGIALGHAGGDVSGEFLQGGDALVQTLAGNSGELEVRPC